jgi:hypothetical protein
VQRLSRSARVIAAALLAVLVLAGCDPFELSTRAQEQAESVLREEGLDVTSVSFSTFGQDTGPEVSVWYESTAPVDAGLDADGFEDKVAEALWTKSITEIGEIAFSESGTTAAGSTLTSAELTERFGSRPQGLVTITGQQLADEEQKLIGGLLGVGLLTGVVIPLLFFLGFALVLVLVIVVIVKASNKPRPPVYPMHQGYQGHPGYPPRQPPPPPGNWGPPPPGTYQ